MKYWKSGADVGIVQDPDGKKITIFAGNAALEINGRDGKIALVGSISEMNGGDRTEDVFLQKQAGLMSLLPSTLFSPIPQATPNIPVNTIKGLVEDIAVMAAMLA